MKAIGESPFPWARRDIVIAGQLRVPLAILHLRTIAPYLPLQGGGIELAVGVGGCCDNSTRRAGHAPVHIH
jgi:hypothetical protein